MTCQCPLTLAHAIAQVLTFCLDTHAIVLLPPRSYNFFPPFFLELQTEEKKECRMQKASSLNLDNAVFFLAYRNSVHFDLPNIPLFCAGGMRAKTRRFGQQM